MEEEHGTFKGLKVPQELEKDGVVECYKVNCWSADLECADCILAFISHDHTEQLEEYLETRGGK